MKRKKWIYIVLLIVLIAPILFFYQAFNGNPVSKYVSKTALKNYLSETYPDHEYRIRDEFYNFKIGGYSYKVVQIGDEQQVDYDFEVTGFFKPKVRYDGIYYANLDVPLMEKLSEEASAELRTVLMEKAPTIVEIDVQLEILKGKYGATTIWTKELKLEKPMYIHLTIDVTNMNKEEVLTVVNSIQNTLEAENYQYRRISINGNRFDNKFTGAKADRGYVKYAVAFDSGSNITLKDIEEYNQ